ncbi:MAG TPA: peroxiredoxin [Actinobacteria bacterium]|nr:peroxiredoxin [Actinomycetota bacterium]
MVAIGEKAPEFTLPTQDREPLSLADLAGRKTVLVFIPFPFTGVCEGELCTLRDHLADLGALDANVVAITCDTVPANKRWSDDNSFSFPVLSDYWPHGEVARAYEAFNEELGCANRRSFVLDEAGVIRAIIESPDLGTPREYDAYVEALRAI